MPSTLWYSELHALLPLRFDKPLVLSITLYACAISYTKPICRQQSRNIFLISEKGHFVTAISSANLIVTAQLQYIIMLLHYTKNFHMQAGTRRLHSEVTSLL